jgi:hypothetical protein
LVNPCIFQEICFLLIQPVPLTQVLIIIIWIDYWDLTNNIIVFIVLVCLHFMHYFFELDMNLCLLLLPPHFSLFLSLSLSLTHTHTHTHTHIYIYIYICWEEHAETLRKLPKTSWEGSKYIKLENLTLLTKRI